MLKCLAIDDEPLALEKLSSYIERVPFLELVASCSNSTEAIKIMSENAVDLLFLDINIPDLSGLDLARSLENPPLIIFTTAYSEYAVEGYKVDAVDYLLKPFSFEDLLRSANKALKFYNLNHQEVSATAPASATPTDGYIETEQDCIFIKSDYKIVRLFIHDIRYLESMSEYVKIYIENAPKPIISLITMHKLEEALPSSIFMRVHRSYLVNLTKIREVSRMRIMLDEETYIPIGDNYKEQFNEFINKRYVGKE